MKAADVPMTQEACMLKSQPKQILIPFFDINDIVHFEFTP
jgi:hypothetical protein